MKKTKSLKTKGTGKATKLKWQFSKGSGVVPQEFGRAKTVKAAAAPGGR